MRSLNHSRYLLKYIKDKSVTVPKTLDLVTPKSSFLISAFHLVCTLSKYTYLDMFMTYSKYAVYSYMNLHRSLQTTKKKRN